MIAQSVREDVSRGVLRLVGNHLLQAVVVVLIAFRKSNVTGMPMYDA
jgi:hypothetical protein